MTINLVLFITLYIRNKLGKGESSERLLNAEIGISRCSQ